MNWYKTNCLERQLGLFSVVFRPKMKKVAYMTKGHSTEFNDTMDKDGYTCKVQLTESKSRVVLSVVFMNEVHSFPLYSEAWKYPKAEIRRAIKTFNRCVNVVEDLKTEYEDDDIPGPTLQGMAREALRYIDLERRNVTPSRSLEAAKYLDGETDWRSSIYGNRMPHQYGYPVQPPSVNIVQNGDGTINFGAKGGP
jgi:hypothetical protein